MISQLGGGIRRMAGVRDALIDVLYLVVAAAPAVPAADVSMKRRLTLKSGRTVFVR